MIIVFMTLSALSLLFVIATAVYAIATSNQLSRKKESTALIVPLNNNVYTADLGSYNKMRISTQFMDGLEREALLPYSENTMYDLSAALLNIYAYYSSTPEIKLEYLMKKPHLEKFFIHSTEDTGGGLLYKSFFFIGLKMVCDLNIEKNDNELYSDVCYYYNKYGGERYGEL